MNTETTTTTAKPEVKVITRDNAIKYASKFYSLLCLSGLAGLKAHGYDLEIVHLRYDDLDAIRAQDEGYKHYTEKLALLYVIRDNFEKSKSFQLLFRAGDTYPSYVSPTGGSTSVKLKIPEFDMEITATALCSVWDPFNRKKGVLIALGHVFTKLCEELGVTKQDVKKAIFDPVASNSPLLEKVV